MTEDKDFKRVVRERADKTGERYTAARRQLTKPTSDDLATVRDGLAGEATRCWQEFRPQLRGLTDEEYLWQPVPGCPSIHQQPDGTYQVDHQFPIVGAATIAQRACWIAQLLTIATNQHFGDRSVTRETIGGVPGTARDGIDYLSTAVDEWITKISHVEPPFLLQHDENRSPGAIDGEFPFVSVIAFHHSLTVQSCAQISMTRDLYVQTHQDMVRC